MLPAITEGPRGPIGAFTPALAPVAASIAIGLDPLLDDVSGQIYVNDGIDLLLDDLSSVIIDGAGAGIASDTTLATADANPIYVSSVPTSVDSGKCYGLASVVKNDGSVIEFAATANAILRLVGQSWLDVSRVTGGAYATSSGERWRFLAFNPYVIATNYTDVPQKYDSTGVNPVFTALAGSPPRARFIGQVREQVVLACILNQENALQFSGRNNSEIWTTGGVNGADIQSFPSGGPITGFVGGAVGHVFQATKVTRMTATTDPAVIFQFDEVQGGKGCVAPNSIVKVGDLIYYFSSDGFQVLSILSGQVKPLGLNKWRAWFLANYLSGSEGFILGAADPLNPVIYWAFRSASSSNSVPDKILVYNWDLDEAATLTVNVEAMTSWLSPSVTLDTMTAYGTLDTLPFSLDSPFWKGGVPLLSIVDATHTVNYFQGKAMAAELITADGRQPGRAMIMGTTPLVDTNAVTGAVAMRERDGDAVTYPTQEIVEDTGAISAFTSGNIGRVRYRIPAGTTWSLFKGVETQLGDAGQR